MYGRRSAPDEQAQIATRHAREAELLSSLNDPRLPKLVGHFSEGDRHYVALEYVEGETLEELVERRGPCSEENVASWGRELAELLAFLHDKQPSVLCGAIQPANILFSAKSPWAKISGQCELSLLGLGAPTPAEQEGASTAMGLSGTDLPELCRRGMDGRGDLYALGATMQYLLTGNRLETQPPFRHPSTRQLRPDVSPSLVGLVDLLLQIPQGRSLHAGSVAAYLAYHHPRRLAWPLFRMYV